jgi:CheY-like chemotaxis protein
MAKILLIEDDELMLRMYQRAFKNAGHNMILASSGKEGLDKIRQDKFDLILLDIMMPKMSGLEVLEKLKADSETSSIPVVILTNLSDKKDAEESLKRGAIEYVIKSDHSINETVDLINKTLGEYTEKKNGDQA